MAQNIKIPAAFWDESHISPPPGFIPFLFNANWLSERMLHCAQSCIKDMWESNINDISSRTLEFLAMDLMNGITMRQKLNLIRNVEARDLLTVCLESVAFCHQKGLRGDIGWVYQLLIMRSGLNVELSNSATALLDLQLSKKLIPSSPEPWLMICKIYIKLENWLQVLREAISVLSHRPILWDQRHVMFTGAIVSLTRSLTRLSGSSFKDIPKGVLLHWVDNNPSLWENIVRGFYVQEDYDGLGILTIGQCDSLLQAPSFPHIPVMRAASIPGIQFRGINVGDILHKLSLRGIKKWHLKMGEFFIQRGADIHTIASEFKQPVLVAVVLLSLHADTPSFLELAWGRLTQEQLDETDHNLFTAFHWLAVRMADPKNRRLANTAEILCNRLLSNGCLPYLRNVEGRLACDLLPETSKLFRMLSEASLDDPPAGLINRLDTLTTLADKKKRESPDAAIDLYEKVAEIQNRYFFSLHYQLAKTRLKLAIMYFKNEEYEKCRHSAKVCQNIEEEFDEVSGKTLYWMACAEEKLGRIGESFRTYLEAFMSSEKREDEVLMLKEGLKLLPRIPGYDNSFAVVVEDFPNIWMNPFSWELVVEVINKKKMWEVLKIFYLGPPYLHRGFYQGLLWDKSASNVDLRGVWDHLDNDSVQAPRLLLALVQRGADHCKLTSDPKEGLHAVVRFCALTNDAAVLSHILGKLKSSNKSVNGTDNDGGSPLHALSQLRNKKVTDQTLLKLSKMLYDAGCDVTLKDYDSKRAVDYATGSLKDWLVRMGKAKPQKESSSTSAQAATRAKSKPKQEMKTMSAAPTASTTTNRQQQTSVPVSGVADNWRTIKEQGNKEYSKRNYGAAIELYSQTLRTMSDKGKNKASNHDRAVILGNMTESYMNMDRWTEALHTAMICRSEDPSWFKAHWRLGRIVEHEEANDRCILLLEESAFNLYFQAYMCIERDENEEKNKMIVLSDILAIQNMTIEDVCGFKLIGESDLLLPLIYHCIVKEDDWKKAEKAHTLIELIGNPSKTHCYDLRFLCKHDKLKDYSQMILQAASLFYYSGSDITSLKFHEGDYYINAMITILVNLKEDRELEQTSLALFLTVLSKSRRMWKDRQKACDDKGCSPLHHVAAIKGNERMRAHLTNILLNERFDPYQPNKANQQAIDLCPGSDAVRRKLEASMLSKPKRGGVKKETQKQSQVCDACEDLLKRANDLNTQKKFSQMYLNLITIINEQGHDSDMRHSQFRKSCVARIAETLGASDTGEIPDRLNQLCQDGLIDVVKTLMQKKKWSQMQALVSKFKSHNAQHRDLFKFLHKSLPIKDVVLNKTICVKEKDRCKVVQFLFENGAKLDLNSTHMILKQTIQAGEFKMVLLLLNNGADPKDLTLTQGDTPLHAALRIALFKDTDNFSIFDWMTSSERKDHAQLDWNVRDKHGNNLLHLAAKATYSHASMMAVERLCKNRVSVTVKNKEGRLPRDLLLNSNDRRAEFLRPKANQTGTENARKSNQAKSHVSQVVDESRGADSTPSGPPPSGENEAQKPKGPVEKGFSVKQCRKQMKGILTDLPDVIIDLFPSLHLDGEEYDDEEEEDEEEEEEEEIDEGEREDEAALPDLDLVWTDDVGSNSETQGKGEKAAILTSDLNPEIFDNFPWEIECTEEVWNVLKNQKKIVKSQKRGKEEISDLLKKEIVGRIQQLARGDWSIARAIDLESESIRLYRVDLSRGAVLLEVAVAFSPKLKDATGPSTNPSPIYSEIIRVWGIVTSKADAHKALHKIILSHRRGKECYVKESLDCNAYNRQEGNNDATSSLSSSHSNLRYPLHYSETCVLDRTTQAGRKEENKELEESKQEEEREELTLCPPASTGKMEFHILKFYSFSSALVSAVLSKNDLKVDFPFKVTPLEHKIISLPSASPVLLLGRSGTGKTTICLYRLWKKFVDYWDKERHHGQPLLPREYPALTDVGEEEACGGEDLSSKTGKTGVKKKEGGEESEGRMKRKAVSVDERGDFGLVGELVCENAWVVPLQDDEEDDDNDDSDDDDGYHDKEVKKGDEDDNDGANHKNIEKKYGEAEELGENGVDAYGPKRRVEYHHLHQVFVTKNQQLCSEVGKTFQRLRNSISFLSEHSQLDDQPLPNTLQDVAERAFPLFVTSRQLLLLLDASLNGTPFFERDENLDLKVNIPGWGTQEEIFHNIPLEGSSDEEFDEFDDKEHGRSGAGGGNEFRGHRRRQVHDFRAGGAVPKRQTDKKRECTYEVFAHQVWPRIAQKKVNEFHPSLVWTEIMSIIKGSYEALHTKNGYLSLEKYQEVGQKRAPNFSGDRDEVYAIFKNYLKHKREKRLFDEADLVFNMHTRLRETPFCPWVFDEIYVDELQDFTQAELTLLIALSHEPNKMFLTGDTAQSIMHGISFRFRDLKSLFYFAKESQKKTEMGLRTIKPPGGVHPLRYNYRSHSGILSLASSVLDLLTRFFPESYDVLDRDQGLFEGPKPVLIQSCSQTDLAVLLSGNQRKTSHIEFGAHQAILVSSQQAKEEISADLKSAIALTIYESKGLEFDDILLYNFFKDSQASKVNEWRVVTSFLKELVEQKKKDGKMDELDSEILSKPGRPHPLTFNPVQHKILNTELKHLYTALTRARVNVWIFDEDQARSAPIFEYFKVLSLVKTVGLETKDKGFGDQLFTKKSTTKEWFAKGDMFMKRKLYEPAAKCFSMAGDENSEKFARAHHLAQKAGQQKQTAMFLEAASLFVQCDRLHPAARCFHRAKENNLAALALEKNGEMKLAADQYKRLNKLVDASLCYERGGMFDLAIGVLVDSQEFERALDCLHRYHNIIKECQLENKPLPQVIIDHRPRDSHSEKHLLYMLAEDYLSRDDEGMMFNTVDRLEDTEDQYQFLLDKGYSERAARILDKMGRTEEAARLLLQENLFQDSLEYARKGKHVHMEACIHLTMAQMQLCPPDDLLPSDYEDELLKAPNTQRQCEDNARRARDLFEKIGDDDGKGQAILVLGCLNKSKDLLNKAHRIFEKMQPPNVAGQLEAFQEMFELQPFTTFDLSECKKGLEMIQKGTQVMKILRQPTKEEEDRHLSCLTFYGLDLIPGSDNVALNPNQLPSVSRKRLASLALHDEPLQSSGKIHKEKSEVLDEIWNSLVSDVTSWAATVEESLTLLTKGGCWDYQAQTAVTNHMESLCLKVELTSLQQTIMSYFNPEPPGEVQSVLPLLDFLPPANPSLCLLDSKVTLKLLKRVRSSETVKSQITRYLLYKWDNPDRVARGKSTDVTKERAKESNWLVEACLFDAMFGLDLHVEKKAKDLEMEIMRLGKEWAKKTHKYAIYVLFNKQTNQVTAVESLGGRFIKSFQTLVGADGPRSKPNPYEAACKFTKLISVFAYRGEPSIMPAPEHLLFWLEFYVSLTFCFMGKVYQDHECTFYLPSSYFHHFDVVNGCRRSHSGSLFTDVVKHKHEFGVYALGKRIAEQQDFLVNFMVGNPRFNKFSLMSYISNFTSSKDEKDHLIAERMVVLCLVLLLNTQYNFVNTANRSRIHKAICLAGVPVDKLPQAVVNLMSDIPKVNSYHQLLDMLSSFLQDHRSESLVLCTWHDKMAPPLQKQTLGHTDMSRRSHDTTEENQDFNSNNSALEEEEEEEIVEMEEFEELDEMERMELESLAQQRQMEQEREMKAAKIIIRFLRLCVLRSQQELEKNPHYQFEERYLFAPYILSPHRCGICGFDLVMASSGETEGQGQTKEVHEMTDKHQSNVEQYKKFKQVYLNKVLKDLLDISKFIKNYEVQEDSPFYARIPIDVKKLLSELSAFHKNLKELMVNRNWSKEVRVTTTFYMLRNTFQKNKNMIKGEYDYFQKKEKERHARLLHAETMADGFVEEEEGTMGTVDYDPSDRPVGGSRVQGGRSVGGGRGRGHRNRGGRGGRGKGRRR